MNNAPELHTELLPELQERFEQASDVDRELTARVARLEIAAAQLEAAVVRLAHEPKPPGRLLPNVYFAAGMGSLVAGCWALSPAVAGIVLGSLLLAGPVVGGVLRQKPSRGKRGKA